MLASTFLSRKLIVAYAPLPVHPLRHTVVIALRSADLVLLFWMVFIFRG